MVLLIVIVGMRSFVRDSGCQRHSSGNFGATGGMVSDAAEAFMDAEPVSCASDGEAAGFACTSVGGEVTGRRLPAQCQTARQPALPVLPWAAK